MKHGRTGESPLSFRQVCQRPSYPFPTAVRCRSFAIFHRSANGLPTPSHRVSHIPERHRTAVGRPGKASLADQPDIPERHRTAVGRGRKAFGRPDGSSAAIPLYARVSFAIFHRSAKGLPRSSHCTCPPIWRSHHGSPAWEGMGRDGKGRGKAWEGVRKGYGKGLRKAFPPFPPLPFDHPSGGLPGLPYPFPWGDRVTG